MQVAEYLVERRDQAPQAPPRIPAPGTIEPDERAARASLRAQIAHLESELSDMIEASEQAPRPTGTRRLAAGPRVLDLGELELVRDELAARLGVMRDTAAQRAECQQQARMLLERMLLDPAGHRFVRVRAADLGQPSCVVYESRPRLGLIGMLMGWWRVTVSSGCPLAGGSRRAP